MNFKAMLVYWIALGVTGGTMVGSALGACLLVPFIGWFFGIPVVLGGALMAGTFWVVVLGFLFIASFFSKG